MAQRYEKEMKKADKKNIIIKYKQYLKLEKSLSANTVEAYLTDLDKLFAFLELENIHFTDVTLENLETFSAGLRDIGIHPRSQARILSGIRSFFRFLLLEDYIQQDPSELLESPQIGKHLPDVLTVEEIDTLIGNIDRGTRERTGLHGKDNATGLFWKLCTVADCVYPNCVILNCPTFT